MSVINYSKWNNIEVSDDEDDTHPNIDTPSLFRWRHKARLERDAEFNKEKQAIDKGYNVFLTELNAAQLKLDEAKKNNSDNLESIKKNYDEIKAKEKEWEEKLAAFKKKERLKPLNIDTICKEGKSFSAINHVDAERDSIENENDPVEKLRKFVTKYDKEIKTFGMFQRPQDTKDYLKKHPYLVCDETANHLLLWCIDLQMEEKKNLMYHVSHQCVLLQFILELGKFKKCDPKAMLDLFFQQFINPQPEYQAGFQAELDAFRSRIEQRAKVKLEETIEKYEEEERQKRLGPGGLDPIEVMESLPPNLRECFEKRDTELLKQVLLSLPQEEAEAHLKRCIDSGLWVENANSLVEDEATYNEPSTEPPQELS